MKLVCHLRATRESQGERGNVRGYALSLTISPAATGFFTPVKITGRTFVDGALGANNPVDQVEEEAADIWCPKTGELKPLDNILKFLSKTLVQITTETEETAKKSIGRWRQHYDSKRYFRFNVEQGLQDVGLAEFKEQGTIMAATDQYLDEQTRVSQVRDCVENVKQKQSVQNRDCIGTTVEAYHTRVVLRQHAQVDIPRHSIPFSKNCQFVGRSEILKTVREKLFGDHGHRSIALVGLGGVGKTQVALWIAHWTNENKSHWSVFWMPAFSRASFERASLELVEELDIEGVEKGDPKQLLRRYLRSSKSGNWLLIVDNADDEEVVFGIDGENGIYDYLPQTDSGRILSTTRSRQIAVDIAGPEVVDVSQMSEGEARELLGKGLTNKTLLRDDKSVAGLLDFLAYFPLAINQEAAYLNKMPISLAEYLLLLRNTEQDLVELLAAEFRDVTRYPRAPNAVATTWIISFKQIQKDEDAANLLFFMSYTEPRAIPRSMLPGAGSEQRTTRAIGTLCGYSFLSRRNGEEVFDMHRLVQVVSRWWIQSREDSNEKKQAALGHLATIFNTDNWDSRDLWRSYLPHVLRTIQGDAGDGGWGLHECQLGFWAGRCLGKEGRNREAAELLEHVVAVRERTLSEEHADRLASQHELASAYEVNGQVKEAVELLEHVVAVEGRTLSEEHPDRLASQHALASAYEANGQVKA
ncbi:hypothetical protein HIM_09283 [Hirsutella minnesotensis 3608]|uniref:NB-ARC domain-containing protein n=1 Tax=Hirsutella minnesotensis 3608 TaxID=1043627 RepID=A0A0F7ZXU8_9HYPO|nr:hypothetical protein HIM_09283 [Hirsutella minnesotensis 3608]